MLNYSSELKKLYEGSGSKSHLYPERQGFLNDLAFPSCIYPWNGISVTPIRNIAVPSYLS